MAKQQPRSAEDLAKAIFRDADKNLQGKQTTPAKPKPPALS